MKVTDFDPDALFVGSLKKYMWAWDNRVGWGLGGSYLYGLETETSDMDVTIIVDSEILDKEYQTQLEGGDVDLRLIPTTRFVEAVSAESSPNYVDLLLAKSFMWKHDHPLLPYVRSAGWSPTKYVDMLNRHTKSMLHQYIEGKKDENRLNKMLKVALRNHWMAEKMLREVENFNPRLTREQREEFIAAHERMKSLERDYEQLVAFMLPTERG